MEYKLSERFRLFALNNCSDYGNEVARCLGVSLSSHIEKNFEDGETYVRSNENVRGGDVYIISSLYGDDHETVNEKLIKLLFFIGSLRDASAQRITAIILSFAYARQDRKVESRAPISSKYVAGLLQAMSCSHVLTLDVHNLAVLQNSFGLSCPVDNLECKNLHADWCANNLADKKLVVLSPDAGGYQRAERFRAALYKRIKSNVGIAILDKLRINGEVHGGRIVGDVGGADVIIYDDIISTGSTISKACESVKNHGGEVAAVCATHGLFVGNANKYLEKINGSIVVSDSIKPFRLNSINTKKLSIVSTSSMVAEAIWRIHSGIGSISELLL
jgi:ribose-phosphate pyrophosphokinase